MAAPIVVLPSKEVLESLAATENDELQARIYDSCDALTQMIETVDELLTKLDGLEYQFSPALHQWSTTRWEALFCGKDESGRVEGEEHWEKCIRENCSLLEVYQQGFWADHMLSGEQAEFKAAVTALFAETRKLWWFLTAELVVIRKKIHLSRALQRHLQLPGGRLVLQDVWSSIVVLKGDLGRSITSFAGDIARVHGFRP